MDLDPIFLGFVNAYNGQPWLLGVQISIFLKPFI